MYIHLSVLLRLSNFGSISVKLTILEIVFGQDYLIFLLLKMKLLIKH